MPVVSTRRDARRILTPLILVTLGLFACSDDPTEPHVPNIPPEDPPRWVRLMGQSHSSRDVEAFAAGDVFVLGANGHISHFDGRRWQLVDVLGGWSMHGLWGTGPDHLLMVGFEGRIVRFDGATWQDESSGTEVTLRGIWGRASNDIFVVGDEGVILHYDGTSWRRQESGSNRDLYAVHGTNDGNVFAAGDGGTVLHRRPGGAWVSLSTQADTRFHGIWAASGEWIVAVGEAGHASAFVLEYVGDEWEGKGWNLGATLHAVSGMSSDDVWAAGNHGAWSWDGDAWNEEFESGNYIGVQYAADGALVLQHEVDHTSVFDGKAWTTWANGIGGGAAQFLWGSSDTDLLVLSSFLVAPIRYDGSVFVPQQKAPPLLREAWGTPDGSKIYIVGDLSRIHVLENGAFRQVHELQTAARLISIWGIDDELWVGGEEGWIAHYDGSAWTESQLPTPARNRWVQDIDGSARDAVYAITTDGIFRLDGATGTLVREFGDEYFLKNVVVAGPEEIYVEGSYESGATNFAVQLHYFDGANWSMALDGPSYSVAELVKAPDGTIIGAGHRLFNPGPPGFVMRGRYTEWSFETVDTGSGSGFETLWVSPTGRIYLADDAIWHSNEP